MARAAAAPRQIARHDNALSVAFVGRIWRAARSAQKRISQRSRLRAAARINSPRCAARAAGGASAHISRHGCAHRLPRGAAFQPQHRAIRAPAPAIAAGARHRHARAARRRHRACKQSIRHRSSSICQQRHQQHHGVNRRRRINAYEAVSPLRIAAGAHLSLEIARRQYGGAARHGASGVAARRRSGKTQTSA